MSRGLLEFTACRFGTSRVTHYVRSTGTAMDTRCGIRRRTWEVFAQFMSGEPSCATCQRLGPTRNVTDKGK